MGKKSSTIDDIIADQEQDEYDSNVKNKPKPGIKNMMSEDEDSDESKEDAEEEDADGDGGGGIETIGGDESEEDDPGSEESDDDEGEEKEDEGGKYSKDGVLIGKVEQFFGKIKVAAVKLCGKLEVGDTIEIHSNDDIIKLKVSSMQIEKESVESADDGDSVGIKVSIPVAVGSKVYRKD